MANIGALFSTIKFFFSLVFDFYSKNFDNYKILGKILSSSSKEPIKKIELSSNLNLSLSPKTEKNIRMKDTDNQEQLIDKTSNENKIIIKETDINKDANEIPIDETNSIVLNKLSFIDFLYNNIYSKCCKKRRN